MTLQRVTALARASDIFRSLGNTGTAVDRRANTGNTGLGASHQTHAVEALMAVDKLAEVVSLRHPDPSSTPTLKVEYPSLQIYGSWKKLYLKKHGGMLPRLGFTSFIWKSEPDALYLEVDGCLLRSH